MLKLFDAGIKMIDKRLQVCRTYQRFLRILLIIWLLVHAHKIRQI